MSERNPYAPPVASVDYVATGPTVSDVSTAPPFFAVSVFKYVVMTISTLGFYQMYWFYKNWQLIKEREGMHGIRITPIVRAIFPVFFCYQCFARVRDYEYAAPEFRQLPAGVLATGWIITTVLWRLPDPYWWISTLAFLFVIPVQLRVNRVNGIVAPAHDPNGRFSGLNWLAIVIASVILSLALIGVLLPQEYAEPP
jgi:hypothetical protein